MHRNLHHSLEAGTGMNNLTANVVKQGSRERLNNTSEQRSLGFET
jgi:hypothetical protein